MLCSSALHRKACLLQLYSITHLPLAFKSSISFWCFSFQLLQPVLPGR
uniref:Uncharacterized protein n=1 Tax=Anguilla anguilla TaxID=7936 RepID=A0A0E9P7C9_ANGAN